MPASLEPRWPRVVALALVAALVPAPAWASRPVSLIQPEAPPAETETPATETPATETESPDDTETAAEPTELEQPTVEAIEPTEAPPSSSGGIASVVDPNDPNATRAQSDLEGESLDAEIAGVPERMPKLQAAGWWTTFAAVGLATTGGIFASIAETRQDQAERLAYGFDLETGRATVYGTVADEYEQQLRQGNSYQWVARGLVIAGGVTLIAAISIFAVDGARRRKLARSSARLHLAPGPGGLSLRF